MGEGCYIELTFEVQQHVQFMVRTVSQDALVDQLRESIAFKVGARVAVQG